MIAHSDEARLLGRGWRLPVALAGGGLQAAEGMAHLRQAIYLILTTAKGERVMRPWFGSELWRYIDAPVNAATLAALRFEIYDALVEEPRLTVQRILISSPSPGWLQVDVYLLVDKTIEVAVRLGYDRDRRRWEVPA